MATLVTNSLTHCLIDLIDVTLTFEDANSKLLDVVSVADINALECEDYSLVENMNLNISFNIECDALSNCEAKFP